MPPRGSIHCGESNLAKLEEKERSEFLTFLQEHVIGDQMRISTCYGERLMTYADWVASGRFVTFVEDYLADQVYPYYANTHTIASLSGKLSTKYREAAREHLATLMGSPETEFTILFTGAGSTGAIFHLTQLLGITKEARIIQHQRKKLAKAKLFGSSKSKASLNPPIVFVTVFEHHSNILPWRESQAQVYTIPSCRRGATTGIDMEVLKCQLQKFADYDGFKCISFSAASNITGIRCNVKIVSELAHKYGFYAFWDYASAGPYVEIDMKEEGQDAIFLSPHKFVGGPGASGILVLRDNIFEHKDIELSPIPMIPGGGTVTYVTRRNHCYLAHMGSREEGGTPNVLADIRASIAFQLKNKVGVDFIEKREKFLSDYAMKQWKHVPNLVILGDLKAPRIATFSFVIRHRDLFLNYNFVSKLLNDLFGIQSRGGCACAGPYGEELLGVLDADMDYPGLMKEIVDGNEILKPGFSRLNFTYFMEQTMVDYMIKAVSFIAEHGWKFLVSYDYDPHSAQWHGKSNDNQVQTINLSPLDSYISEWQRKSVVVRTHEPISRREINKLYGQYLREAEELLPSLLAEAKEVDLSALKEVDRPWLENEYCSFLTVSEAVEELLDSDNRSQRVSPYLPPTQEYWEGAGKPVPPADTKLTYFDEVPRKRHHRLRFSKKKIIKYS